MLNCFLTKLIGDELAIKIEQLEFKIMNEKKQNNLS